MGTVPALAAHYGFAGLTQFESHFNDESTIAFRPGYDGARPEVDAAYPAKMD